jgi:hypothetical protein
LSRPNALPPYPSVRLQGPGGGLKISSRFRGPRGAEKPKAILNGSDRARLGPDGRGCLGDNPASSAAAARSNFLSPPTLSSRSVRVPCAVGIARSSSPQRSMARARIRVWLKNAGAAGTAQRKGLESQRVSQARRSGRPPPPPARQGEAQVEAYGIAMR